MHNTKVQIFRGENCYHYAFQAQPALDPELRVGCLIDPEDPDKLWWVFWERKQDDKWVMCNNFAKFAAIDEILAFATAGAWAVTGGVMED